MRKKSLKNDVHFSNVAKSYAGLIGPCSNWKLVVTNQLRELQPIKCYLESIHDYWSLVLTKKHWIGVRHTCGKKIFWNVNGRLTQILANTC